MRGDIVVMMILMEVNIIANDDITTENTLNYRLAILPSATYEVCIKLLNNGLSIRSMQL